MKSYDDDLRNFEAQGAAPLPVANDQSYVDHGGARIWHATYGAGSPVILLRGGLGHSGNWGYQVPMLVGSGHRRAYRQPRPRPEYTRFAALYIRINGIGRSRSDGRVAIGKSGNCGLE
jgi:pimeloyl-ACP methyl ester carboxylesterase